VRERQVWLDPNEFNEISIALVVLRRPKVFLFFIFSGTINKGENSSLFSTGNKTKNEKKT